MAPSTRSALAPFLILFAALYAGFGVQSPYLPALLDDRGLRPEAIGMVLASGTAVRLAAGPAAGRLADRIDAAKLVFAGCAVAAALMALLYLSAQRFWPLFAVGLLQAAALAPLAPLCDTLALGAAAPTRRDDAGGPGFDYGWFGVPAPPGAWSSQRHWHAKEDEFIYVLSGEVVLATDAGEEVLSAGDCAGFKSGDPDGHCLQNHGTADAIVLEIGSRIPGEYATYSDIDMKTEPGVGYVHKNGTRYPKMTRRGPG